MFLLWPPAPAPAAELHVVSETILRGFERQSAAGEKLKAFPAYEYLQLDFNNIESTGLSLHLNGWGRLNLGDNYNQGNTEDELLHAYLQYVPVENPFQFRAGRQYIFEGVARDSIDGFYLKSYLNPAITVSGYAGSPVSLDTINGRNGDLIFGGKVTYYRPKFFDAGVSYRRVADDGNRKEEMLGTDLTVLFPRDISLIGHSAYDLVSQKWGEHSYDMRIPWGPVTFQPFLHRFRYESFFTKDSANPFRFLKGTENTLTVVGTEAFWYPSDHEEFVLRFKNFDYDQRFKNSQLYSLLAVKKWKILSEVGAELGRMQGSDAENRYLLSRGYFYWNLAPGFVTADLMYVHYDEPIYTENSSLFASVGVGRKLLDDRLSVKLSFDYSKDPYLDGDYRSMLKVDYHLDKTFGTPPPKD